MLYDFFFSWPLLAAGLATFALLVSHWLVSYHPKKIPDFRGKRIIITGGSAGLGKALAVKFAELGAHVAIVARNPNKLKEAQKEVESHRRDAGSQKVCALSADVSTFADIDAAVKAAVAALGGAPDIVIPNAGVSKPGYFVDIAPEVLEQEQKLNYLGAVFTVKACLPYMISNSDKSGGGHIVLVSSAAAFANFVGFSSYSASKAALKALADGLRNELLLYDIGVSIFYPGPMDTEGFAEEQKTKPEECKAIEGSATLFSAEHAASCLVDGLRRGRFAITQDFFPTELLRCLSNGISVRDRPLVDALMTPLLVILGPLLTYLAFDSVVLSSRAKKVSKKNA